jgi:VWFA-related protein
MRHAGSCFLTAAIVFGAAAWGSTGPAAPSRGQDAGKPIQHEVSVTVRLVQVYVSDRSGNAILDLNKEDFVVYDEGMAVAITEFERHSSATAGPIREPVPEPAAAIKEPMVLGRKFFIMFDFAFNSPFGARAAVKAAQHFIDTEAGPGDEVAVLSYSAAKGLKVHEFLTADLAKARQAVAGISAKEISGRAEEIEREYWDLRGYTTSDTKDPFLKVEVLRTEAGRRQSKFQAQDYLSTLTALAKAMRLVPGSKSFLLFSTGIPTTLVQGNPAIAQGTGMGRGAISEPSQFSYDMGDRTLQPLWEDLLKEFSTADCPFFVLDTREASKQTDLFGADKLAGAGSANATGFKSGLLGTDTTNPFADDKVTGIDMLRALSKRTGGKYYSSIGSYENNLAAVSDLTGAFYVLGYYPASAEDGKFHRIKVEVQRKGARVMAPSGFYDPKPFAGYTKLEKDLHLFDLALSGRAVSRLPLSIPVTALASGTTDGGGLKVLARVPGEVTARLTGGKVEYVAIVFDDQGDIRDIRRGESEAPQSRGRAVVFGASAKLGPGDYSCRVVVRDMDTGLSAVGSTKAAVRAPVAQGLRLWTPLLLAEETGTARIEATAGKGRTTVPWDEIYAYDRTRFSPTAGLFSRLAPRLLAVVPYSVPGATETDLVLSARFINAANGQAFPAIPILAGKSVHPVASSMALELPLAGLAPGTYHLYINAEDRVSKTMAGTRTTVTISPE